MLILQKWFQHLHGYFRGEEWEDGCVMAFNKCFIKWLLSSLLGINILSLEDRWGGSYSFPVSMQNLRSSRSTNIEKNSEVSHNKESHKVKVLAKIYFSLTE
jgi:hypothetical protein